MPVRLLLRNLLAHPIRAALTVGSVAVAVFLLCILDATGRALTESLASASRTRLWVQSAVSLYVNLPLAYRTKIAQVEGIADVCRFQWFGGFYQDPSNFFAQFAVDVDRWLPYYPELSIVDGSVEQFRTQRTSCVIGSDLADRFGWKVGDRVPLIGTIFPRADGGAWEFDVAGIYRSSSANQDQMTLWFHYDYLAEGIEQGTVIGPPGVGVFLIPIEPDADPDAVKMAVNDLFMNGPQRVRTTTEAEFTRQFLTMLGSVPTLLNSVGGGVLFAIFFAVLNTMLMVSRERVRDIGILKALGFGNPTITGLFLAEALLVCLIGGLVGMGLATAAERPIWIFISSMIPGFAITQAVQLQGLLLAGGIGLLAGLFPAWRDGRLLPITALRTDA